MHLSAYTNYTLRTRDAAEQPFTGYGLTVTADDLARLGLALARGEFRNHLDEDMYDQALRPAIARPKHAPDLHTGYQHGFWSIDAGPWLGCDQYTPFVFLSGYGGINLAMFPGEIVYYMVSDGGDFNLEEPARAAHSLKPFCTG